MSPKVAHLTSVHQRHDTRIFYKMCKSGKTHGFKIFLVVADGKKDSEIDGIFVRDVGRSRSRLHRMWKTTNRVFQTAVSINADLYHLHDPELMPIGLKLKNQGKRVIFDSHEDFPKQLLGKPYLPIFVNWVFSRFFAQYETFACKRFDGIIAAAPLNKKKFLQINRNTIDICNYPIISELQRKTRINKKNFSVCYVGGLTRSRGISELITAVEQCRKDIRLNLCGRFESFTYEKEVRSLAGWRKVDFHGFVGRDKVREILNRSLAGMVTLHPLANYVEALAVKMFEYMSVGIPVIASDFPLWREIINGNSCGLLVDPLNPEAIAAAIDKLVEDPHYARYMGVNGQKAIREKYNWGIEENKLIAFYQKILSRASISTSL